jgi:hypothetical protein
MAAGPLLIATPDGARAQGLQTFTSSWTHSETVVNTTTTTTTNSSQIAVPGGGPLPALLTQLINGPNGAAVLSGLTKVMGASTVSQTSTSTTTSTSATTPTGTPVTGAYQTFGPAVIPIGLNPGTMNCNGAPSPASGTGVWPVSNCNFGGYQTFTVNAGTVNVNTNTHTFFLTEVLTQINIVTQAQVNLTTQGFNWLTGDLHATFQTTILDDDFRFIDFLLGRGGLSGGANNSVSMVTLAFSAEPVASAGFEQALA